MLPFRMATRSVRKKTSLSQLEILGGVDRKRTWNEHIVHIRGVPFVYPRWNDARYIQLIAHATYAFLGQLAYAFEVTPGEITLVLLLAVVLDMGWNWFLRRIIIFPASGLIGGLGLVMFLRMTPGTPSYLLYTLAIVLTISSKYIFALRTEGGKNHIFNPSNFGIVTMLLLFPGMTFIRPDQWDPTIPLLCLVLALGITLVWRAKVLWLTFCFILAESVLFLIHRGGLGDYSPGRILGILQTYWLITPTLLVFSFHMLSDPRTVPKTQTGRTIHSISTAMLHWLLLAFGLGRAAIFLAPFIVCLGGALPKMKALYDAQKKKA